MSNWSTQESKPSNPDEYNGWCNYATWRVNLEIFEGFDPYDNFPDNQATMREWLADSLKEHAETLIHEAGGGNGNIAVDYALAFLSDVNWCEIADHLIEDYTPAEDLDAEKTYKAWRTVGQAIGDYK